MCRGPVAPLLKTLGALSSPRNWIEEGVFAMNALTFWNVYVVPPSVLCAVGPHQPARYGDARARTLAGDAVVRDRPGEVDDRRRQVDASARHQAGDSGRRGVVTKLELVRRAVRQNAL